MPHQLVPKPGELLDVGCGTETPTILIKARALSAHVVGLDPDPVVLARAAAKVRSAGLEIEWRRGFAREAGSLDLQFDKAVRSKVFHQVPVAEKEGGIAAIVEAACPGGEVHIADFAHQRSVLMRMLFGIVECIDGPENTKPNARGVLERIIGRIDPAAAEPKRIMPTPLGEISLFMWRTPSRG